MSLWNATALPPVGVAGEVLTVVDGRWTAAPSTGAGFWGAIGGDIADQLDLQSALALRAPLHSPALTGTPTAPTQPVGDDTMKIATTAFVSAVGTTLTAALALKAPLESPALTGTPTAPTAARTLFGDETIATTEYAICANDHRVIDLVDDHEARLPAGRLNWSTMTAGSGATAASIVVAGRHGVVVLPTGTTATGRCCIAHETSTLAGPYDIAQLTDFSFESIFMVETLSVAVVNQFTTSLGFARNGNSASLDFLDGVCLSYDETISPNWLVTARTAGVNTVQTAATDPAAVVTAGQWTYCRFEYHAATGVEIYMGLTKESAVLIGTVTPAQITFTQGCGPMRVIRKSAGVTSRRLLIDWTRFRAITTLR